MGKMKSVLSFIGGIFGKSISVPFFILLVLLLGSGYLTYRTITKYPETFGLLKGPSIIKKEEKALVAEISKTFTLPKDEEPTVATVTEPEKLAGQAFFKDAKKDDKILIYQKSKKVILYRPSERRVVEVGVVNISQQDGEIKVLESYKFALLNGTEKEEALDSFESKLKEIVSEPDFVKTAKSLKPYDKSIIVDVLGDKEELVKKLAEQLGIEVGSMPAEEEAVEGVDFIVIVGSDKAS